MKWVQLLPHRQPQKQPKYKYKQDEGRTTHAGSSSVLFLPKKHCDERLRSYRKLSTFSLQNSSPGGIGTRNWNFSANSYFEDRSIAVLQKLKDK